MKKSIFLFLLLLCLCLSAAHAESGAQAESGVLPRDTETFPPVAWADGVTRLDWGGPTLPAGTAYTVLEIAYTGWENELGVEVAPLRKFARIAYTDEAGKEREAWVMYYNLHPALPVELNSEEDAMQYARRFFTNAYVQAAGEDSPITVTPCETGWRAYLKDAQGQTTHSLSFERDGKIAWYQDCGQPLQPPMFTEHNDRLFATAEDRGVLGTLEWFSQELLPLESFESIATVEQDGSLFTFFINRKDQYVLASSVPTPHIVRYINFTLEDVIEPYLGQEDALSLAWEALRKGQSLSESESQNWEATDANFRFQRFVDGQPSLPGPYWAFVFAEPDAENGYEVLLNAQTGDILQITYPIPLGNG